MKPVTIAKNVLPRCRCFFRDPPLTTADHKLWAAKFGRLILDCFWYQWKIMCLVAWGRVLLEALPAQGIQSSNGTVPLFRTSNPCKEAR